MVTSGRIPGVLEARLGREAGVERAILETPRTPLEALLTIRDSVVRAESPDRLPLVAGHAGRSDRERPAQTIAAGHAPSDGQEVTSGPGRPRAAGAKGPSELAEQIEQRAAHLGPDREDTGAGRVLRAGLNLTDDLPENLGVAL